MNTPTPNLQRVNDHKIGPQRLAAYAWPGGYPIIYIVDEHLQVCPKCANSGEFTTAEEHPDWGRMQVITSAHINYEDEGEHCAECHEPLESAYGADEPTPQDLFRDAVSQNLDGIHSVSTGNVEPEFSWAACDGCGTHLGGDRYSATANLDASSEIVHLEICVDCVMFHANGDEPEEWRAHI